MIVTKRQHCLCQFLGELQHCPCELLRTMLIKEKKNSFLTIQFWLEFGFDHRTPNPDIFGHPTIKTVQIWSSSSFWWVVLIFLFTIKSLDLKIIITFCPYLRFMSFLRSRIRNGELYLLKYFLYYFITISYIILILLCKNNNIRKVK